MKHTVFRKIVFTLLIIGLLAGCGRQSTETKPAYDAHSATVSTIPVESSGNDRIQNNDGLSNAETDTAPSGNIVEIDFAPEDYYVNPKNYEVYHFEDLEYGYDIILNPSTEIYDFEFFSIDPESLFSNGEYKISEILHTCNMISPNKPFVTRIYMLGPGSQHYGVSFCDAFGNQYRYVIFESGETGVPYLMSF